MDLNTIIGLITKFGPQVPQILSVVKQLEEMAKQLFPQVPQDQLTNAATTLANVEGVKWTQSALNILGTDPRLEVDGKYGTMTKQAVTKFQQSWGVSPVDGWAGPVTNEAMRKALESI